MLEQLYRFCWIAWNMLIWLSNLSLVQCIYSFQNVPGGQWPGGNMVSTMGPVRMQPQQQPPQRMVTFMPVFLLHFLQILTSLYNYHPFTTTCCIFKGRWMSQSSKYCFELQWVNLLFRIFVCNQLMMLVLLLFICEIVSLNVNIHVWVLNSIIISVWTLEYVSHNVWHIW